ncbi:MAG: hypothetical protein E6R03_00565 [Hyphomicrobiaceae bacterium]|nr:MAG: hypothetical protein E6R03_00565 [Hyphomicrobiaceae bacterium]
MAAKTKSRSKPVRGQSKPKKAKVNPAIVPAGTADGISDPTMSLLTAALEGRFALTPAQQESVTKLMQSQRQGGRLFLAALASTRGRRIQQYMLRLATVEDAIFGPDSKRVQTAELKDLIKLAEYLSGEVRHDQEFIRQTAEVDSLPAALRELADQFDPRKETLTTKVTPGERDRIRSILQHIKASKSNA